MARTRKTATAAVAATSESQVESINRFIRTFGFLVVGENPPTSVAALTAAILTALAGRPPTVEEQIKTATSKLGLPSDVFLNILSLSAAAAEIHSSPLGEETFSLTVGWLAKNNPKIEKLSLTALRLEKDAKAAAAAARK